MIAPIAAALLTVIPVHGTVLDTLSDRTAIVRTDAIAPSTPAQTRRYRFAPPAAFRTGTTIDALLEASSRIPTLRDAVAAAAFAPGLPEAARVVPIQIGALIPSAELVDQDGHLVHLGSAFRGRTLLLSFVFTRCPDRTLCPTISGKFGYLSARLEPSRFALAEISLDPQYDSPAVLRAYGAAFTRNPANWSLLTGTGSVITRVLDQFGISSMRVSESNFLHSDRLFIVTPAGRVAYIVETGGWDPASVIAQARAVSGLASNPFERFRLALVASMIALCGGSEYAGIAVLELTLFTLLTAIALAGMWVVARVLWPAATPKDDPAT
jgi:protein SCO1/2